ncbi:unnamed protein product [Rhizophagus irregularis]|nr:unnamed protein product [Rhizophagus irregularis]
MFSRNILLTKNNILTYLETNFTNWTSRNEKIDDFIQERQLKINNCYEEIVLEWIPYNQFNEIKKTGKNSLMTVYSAIWKDGPLHYKNLKRDSNKKVALKCLYNLQESIDSLINEAKKYLTKHEVFQVEVCKRNPEPRNPKPARTRIWVWAGKLSLKFTWAGSRLAHEFSLNPDFHTGDYVFVQSYTINLANWISGNEKIDNFIQERQLKIGYDDIVLEWTGKNSDNDIVFEWIPYNQFNEIKETGKNSLMTVYSAIWKDGPLNYKNQKRVSNEKVALKCLYDLQESIDSLINEAKKYSIKCEAFQVLYGISQNQNTGDYIFVQSYTINLANWISGNEKIDDFIQERQLKINNYDDIMFEWIPYNQFNEIEETGKDGQITIYSAIWKDGPLHYQYSEYTRDSNKKVALKCLHNSQKSIDSLINEAKKYSTEHKVFQVLYGISQNPDTGDYIFVQSYTINLENWISGNEKIDNFIQEMQLKSNDWNDIVLKWIPYNQFNEIEETGKNGLIIVYSAIWKDGPLYKKSLWNENYTRDSNKKVALKCLHNLQSIDSLINEAKKYSTNSSTLQALYGISQNPVTEDYIFVQNNYIWTSGNEKVDNFIQEMQLKINDYNDIDGPLHYRIRDSNKKVALKCLHNSQESIDFLINEAKKYSIKHKEFQLLYGISQNSDTGDYVFVQSYTINMANWISGNEKIDEFIQEMQLKINDYNDIVFEWIPCNQFNEIKETGKNGQITIYSAIWKDGPLHYQYSEYTRDSNKKVALKYLHNSQSIDSLINEAEKYITKHKAFQILYGISQNPDTEDYI